MPYDRTAFVTRTPNEGISFDFMVEQDGLLADKLFTPKSVSKRETSVYQFDTSKLRLVETRKKTDDKADLIDEQVFKRNITLDEHKLGKKVNPMHVRDADVPSMVDEGRAVKVVTLSLMLKREDLAATLATTVANYPSDLTSALSTGSKWNENAGDPESDKVTVDNALINRCGRAANAVAMSGDTYRKLKLSPNFRDRVKYTTGGPVTREAMKAFFEVDYFFVGDARYDSVAEGGTVSVSNFWGANVVFFVYNPGVGLEDMSYGHMYLKEAPFWTKTITLEDRNGPAGPVRQVEVGTEYTLDRGFVVSSSDSDFAAGYLLRTAVA